jgi:site-specific DNA-methyltransferase (adenine-specific)|tara:strand:- start:1217 stop:1909 length:693 start_codon:yes stop_codon:yes gene_type:complete
MIEYIKGDIHDIIKTIEKNKIDFIYTDPPFSTTHASWDKKLNWEVLFKEMWRVLKPNGVIALHSAIPFTYELLKYETPKYNYNWKKNNSTGFFSAKYQPLRTMEEIFIYYKKRGTYNPQMIGDKYVNKRNVKYGGKNGYWGEDGINKDNQYIQDEGHRGKYPTTFLEYPIRKGKGNGITRCDDMIDYFIKTYSNEGDTILDMTCHNNIVGARCDILKRNYIGVDIQEITF